MAFQISDPTLAHGRKATYIRDEGRSGPHWRRATASKDVAQGRLGLLLSEYDPDEVCTPQVDCLGQEGVSLPRRARRGGTILQRSQHSTAA